MFAVSLTNDFSDLYWGAMERFFRVYILGKYSYDREGPCHIWKPETPPPPQKHEFTAKKLETMNEVLEPTMREQ